MVKSYEQLAEKVGNCGVSVEEAIDHFMRYKGDEIVRGAKPFIRDLVEQWKTFKNSKTGLSSKFVTEISSYARFHQKAVGRHETRGSNPTFYTGSRF